MANYAHNPLCITPKMTSPNTPEPVVISYSSQFDSEFWAAWNAFSQTTDKSWSPLGTEPPQWIKVDLGAGAGRSITGYTVVGRHDNFTQYNAIEWTLAGSKDDSTWTNLDSQTAQFLGESPLMYTYTLSGKSAIYRYFRITSTATPTGGGAGCFGEIELLGARPRTPSPLAMRGRLRMR